MKKPVIEFIDFSFQYQAQTEPTLHQINLTIHEGEKVLIVGPSGSGKSTISHCLNALVPYYYPGEMQGDVRIHGQSLKELSVHKCSEMVGTVLQDPDMQFIGLTVAEDIAFKLENQGVQQGAMIERVAAAARKVRIDSHLAASPHSLSGGQKQRTSLGGVIVDEAISILLFDEPLANLDPHTGKQAIELIDQLHQETGSTVVIIEHRLEDVLHRPVDRVIVIQDGRIIADDSARALLCSNVLQATGLREPLYITALKYAGCAIAGELELQHIDALKLERVKPSLSAWYAGQTAEPAAAAGKPLLELERVTFGYDPDEPIVHDVSFVIHEGEMVSIVGKNGAGKSTISKLICGFYRPQAGRIMLQGRDLAGDTIKERAQRIGFVMQNPNQMISKVMLYDEVALGLQLRGVPEDEIRERVIEALRICGLYELRNWPISALSFGQKKRVTVAAILVLRPDIIILDEPTAGQDYRHYNEMMEFLTELNRHGMTIIMITHDMHLMLEYASRTIVLADGRKLADASPADVLTDAELVHAAHLKETSVFELAVRAGLDEPKAFVSRFIEYDRRMRKR